LGKGLRIRENLRVFGVPSDRIKSGSEWRTIALAVGLLCLGGSSSVSAADQIYFPAVDNVTNLLVQRINTETVRIDISSWYLTEHSISIALVNRFQAGVPIRLIGDRGSIFDIDPITKREFYWLASFGVPIRLRYNPTWFPEIDHWKATIFAGQRLVAFGSPNYTPFELAPASATNYDDETVIFSDDQTLVNAFRTKFDRFWNDTTPEPESLVATPPYFKNWDDACALESACSDYHALYPNPVPMVISTARLEADFATPPDLIWGQGPDFNNRLAQEINNERTRVDFVIYRLTVDNITQALLAKHQSGVPMRIIIEPNEYLNQKWPEFWLTHANIDKLWASGVPIKQRIHTGLTHMKTLITSAYATNASSNFSAGWERDTNYFIPAASKPAIYQAVKDRFQTMWTDASGFADFVPQPPDAPTLESPASGATAVAARPTLVWDAAPFAVGYDVYLGTSQANMALVGNVPAQLVNNPPSTYSWTPARRLTSGARYFWKVISRTNATVVNPLLVGASPISVFTTDPAPDDFDGDGKADLTVFRSSTGTWYTRSSSTGADMFAQWGLSGDVPVPGDYDGDGKTDLAVFRPSSGIWYILNSSTGTPAFVQWGLPGDVPVPGDYDGDGKTDVVVFRPSTGMWYVVYSSTGTQALYQWGLSGDVPVPGDYDGDGKTDIAVFRPSTGIWYVQLSSTGTQAFFQWGLSGDVPVPGDYDGDGMTDIAVFRPSTGIWYIVNSSTGTRAFYQWGLNGDVPVPGDYDGDGKTDIAVFRPSTAIWYIVNSSTGTLAFYQWGLNGDIPILRR
jgi:phosphatidylserine/phosphatidylglycerophosphate/cardiolipin synthase-like enzyme